MLTFRFGRREGYCDRASRRDFLKIGALGVGGLTLADMLRAEDAQGHSSPHKAVINIFLGGGPSHQDMFDLKPQAPVEFRGEFNPIKTNVTGLEICELFPKLATMADKFAVVRSITGKVNQHSSFQTQTGYTDKSLRNLGGRPAMGSVLAKLQGSSASGAPPFVSYQSASPGYLGPVYRPYQPRGGNLRLQGALTVERLANRRNLLGALDSLRRDIDSTGQMAAVDKFTEQAVGVVCSGKVADALDVKKEDPRIVERYTREGRNFLIARRLVEAGVRSVSFNWGGWDTHDKNFDKLRTQLPRLDAALSSLLADLAERGLDGDVSIVMWGEFGRTPRVNNRAGRDHWNRASFAFLAGGGMRLGQAIGSTTRYAEEPKDRPVHVQQVFATLYHNLGIDPKTTQLIDPAGRPQYLIDHREAISELV